MKLMIPVGKQTNRPSHIFYTPCTGIWQTVWLEPVPQAHIASLDISADMYGQGESPSAMESELTISQHDRPLFL